MTELTIKQIFDEIAGISSTNAKIAALKKYKDNELLKRVLYMAYSGRVKFYIKQIPQAMPITDGIVINSGELLRWGLNELSPLSERKITGNNAIEHLRKTLMLLDADSKHVIECIIDKDCRIGMARQNINKVFPDLIEKTGYMGCKPYSRKLIEKLLAKGKCYCQEKMDGRFANIIIRNGKVMMESRQGEPTILESPYFLTELVQLKDCVLNGELTMAGGISRYESNGIVSSLISIATKKMEGEDVTKDIAKLESKHMPYQEALRLIRFTAWDILTLDEYYNRSCNRPYHERFNELNETLKGYKTLAVVETRIVSTMEEIMAFFNEIIARNGEGCVVKSMDGVWADTKPSYQVKVKKEINLDLRIIGFKYGTGKNINLISSIDVESEEGLLKTSPCGISEDDMEYITANQEMLMGTILEIKCSGISQDVNGNYSVLHPVYKGLRTDKTVANTLAECIEINNSVTL